MRQIILQNEKYRIVRIEAPAEEEENARKLSLHTNYAFEKAWPDAMGNPAWIGCSQKEVVKGILDAIPSKKEDTA